MVACGEIAFPTHRVGNDPRQFVMLGHPAQHLADVYKRQLLQRCRVEDFVFLRNGGFLADPEGIGAADRSLDKLGHVEAGLVLGRVGEPGDEDQIGGATRRVRERDHRTGDFEQFHLPQSLIGRPHHVLRIGAEQRIGDLDADRAAAALVGAQALAEVEGQLVGTGGGKVDAVILAHADLSLIHI